jgi:SAM-dependent methyltransferase
VEKRQARDLARLRGPFQGVWNIVRFNWHFYALALGSIVGLVGLGHRAVGPWAVAAQLAAGLAGASTLISLLVSYYVYDLAGLYALAWAGRAGVGQVVVNVNAGFDETSSLLAAKLQPAELKVFDFYDPARHTEASIRRARRAYPAYPGTQTVATGRLPLADASVDSVFAILVAHEIRDAAERAQFFGELCRICKPGGQVFVTEHLRDLPNFLAYNLGSFHFHSRASWLQTFAAAGLQLGQELKQTPFISTFVLIKDGNPT